MLPFKKKTGLISRLKSGDTARTYPIFALLLSFIYLITFEDLNTKGMVKNHCRAKHIANAAGSVPLVL